MTRQDQPCRPARRGGAAARRRLAVVSVGVAQVLLASQARADIYNMLIPPVLPDDYARDRNVAVLEQPTPDFDPVGVQVGSFRVNPQLTTTAGATSNVFENDDNRKSDAYLALLPYIHVGSDWSRHAVTLDTGAEVRRYIGNPLVNKNNWYANLQGTIEANDRFKIVLDSDVGHYFNAPYASDAASTLELLLNYTQFIERATAVYTAGRVRLTAATSYVTFSYSPLVQAGQPTEAETFRNQHVVAGALHGEYALSPSVAAFTEFNADSTSYPVALPDGTPNRNSNGQRILAGVNFDVAGLMRGQIGLGYTRRSYAAGIYSRVSGYSYQAKVDVFPNELTTATISASRTLQDDTNGGSDPYFDSRVSLQVDHSFMENFIASANVQRIEQTIVGVDSRRQLIAFGTNATYRFTRSLSIAAAINDNISHKTGANFGTPFSEVYGTLSVTIRR